MTAMGESRRPILASLLLVKRYPCSHEFNRPQVAHGTRGVVHALAVVDALGWLLFLCGNRPVGVVAIADRSGARRYRMHHDLGHCAGSRASYPAVAARLDGVFLDGAAQQHNSVSSHCLGAERN